MNRLVEYDLVYEAGRLDAPGRPALFATTEEFLRRFGVGSTEQLPEMNVAFFQSKLFKKSLSSFSIANVSAEFSAASYPGIVTPANLATA